MDRNDNNKSKSVEFLLKQVYAVHRNKVKELENQLKETRDEQERLKEAYERQLKEKDELIRRLQSQLERTKYEDEIEVESLVFDSEKSSKRKREEISKFRTNETKIERCDRSSQVSFTRIGNVIRTNVVKKEEETDCGSFVSIDTEEYDFLVTNKKTDREIVDVVAETVDNWSTETKKETEKNRKAEYYLEKMMENDKTGNEPANRSFDDFLIPNGRRNDERSPRKKKSKLGGDQSTSKYPLYFDKPTKSYRRPKYKQTTLTQNVIPIVDEDVKRAIQESRETYELTMLDNETKLSQREEASLDETYIPSQFLRKDSAELKEIVSKVDDDEVEILVENSDDDSTCSEDLLSEFRTKSSELKGNLTNPKVRSNDDFLNDFDVVPSTKLSPNYKYKRETIRKQEERRKLDGQECRDCEAYFKEMGLTDEEKRIRLKACSRHRDKYVAPSTPDHFWSIHFPTTQECKERGILNTTQHEPLRGRRQRQRL